MISILFVCLGNICRSPAAEGVFRKRASDSLSAHQLEQVYIDSAGTSAHHVGEQADPRMRSSAAKRGYNLDSLSRAFRCPEDFDRFDHIIVMDASNHTNVTSLARTNRDLSKVQFFSEWIDQKGTHFDVPDPYYGGDQGFEHVLDLVEKASDGLLAEIKSKLAVQNRNTNPEKELS